MKVGTATIISALIFALYVIEKAVQNADQTNVLYFLAVIGGGTIVFLFLIGNTLIEEACEVQKNKQDE